MGDILADIEGKKLMSECISVLIADDNVEFCRMLHEYLEQSGGIKVSGAAKDGIETLRLVNELEPDVIILDIIMPNLDGIGVLERLSMRPPEKRPIIIALTAVGTDFFVKKAIEMGADYYIVKPFDVEILASRIRQLYAEKAADHGMLSDMMKAGSGFASDDRSYTEQVVSTMIKILGITPNIAGYRYLREAVMMCIDHPASVKSVSKNIYPVLAEKYNTTGRNIDRAIRCAILSANKKLKYTDDPEKAMIATIGRSKPSNAQIIAFLAEKALQKRIENNVG